MNDIILLMLSITTVLVIYWAIAGQWRYNKMMKQPQNVQAVLFDLDGVLIDSEEAWFNVFNKTRQRYKMPKVARDEFHNNIWGISFENAAGKYLKSADVAKLREYYFSQVKEFLSKTSIIYAADEALAGLKKRQFKTAIVSNTNHKIVEEMLAHHSLAKYFDAVVGGDDVKKGKPEPDSILEACRQLDVQPQNAVMVGDTVNDSEASKAAGTVFVGYKISGDYKINNLTELLMLV